MEMFGVMSMASTLMVPYVAAFMLLPVILYVTARWRQSKAPHDDPQLGLKSLLAYFRVLSFQLSLAGVWALVYAIIHDGDGEVFARIGVGLLIPGAAVFALHHYALKRTNAELLPMPVRLFDGLNLAQTGFMGMFTLVGAFVITMQEDPPGEILRVYWSLAIVYCAAWGGLAASFFKGLQFHPASVDVVPPPGTAHGD